METLLTNAPNTPLHQRMRQGMLMRGLGFHTEQDYGRHARRFAVFLWLQPGDHCWLKHLRPAAIALKVPFRSTTKAPAVSGNTIISYCFATARLKSGSSVRI